jgi:hypothetical protein
VRGYGVSSGDELFRRATRFEGAKAHYVVQDARDNVLARTVSGWGERSVITVGAARYDFRRSLRRSRFAVTNAANSEPLLTTRIVAGARSADTPIHFRGHPPEVWRTPL